MLNFPWSQSVFQHEFGCRLLAIERQPSNAPWICDIGKPPNCKIRFQACFKPCVLTGMPYTIAPAACPTIMPGLKTSAIVLCKLECLLKVLEATALSQTLPMGRLTDSVVREYLHLGRKRLIRMHLPLEYTRQEICSEIAIVVALLMVCSDCRACQAWVP